MGRITVPGQSRQKSLKDPISTNKSWACWYMPVISAIGESTNRMWFRLARAKPQDLI
jgi:hypothetical protein